MSRDATDPELRASIDVCAKNLAAGRIARGLVVPQEPIEGWVVRTYEAQAECRNDGEYDMVLAALADLP